VVSSIIRGWAACPSGGLTPARTNGRDRRGSQRYECQRCGRGFTRTGGAPFAGCRCPPDIIALAVRYYLRYRLSYADLAAWLAERGVHVDRSTLDDRVQRFTPLYQAAARPHRCPVGRVWKVDETYVRVAGAWQYAYRAVDVHGQVIDVYVSPHRAEADATEFVRRSLESTGGRPRRVTTDTAAAYPPALAAVLPEAEHATGKVLQQAIERDHQYLKGRLRPMRGFKNRASAQLVCAGHGFVRNVQRGCYGLGLTAGPAILEPPLLMRAWEDLTALLLVG
jgi:transposase, IS6 family